MSEEYHKSIYKPIDKVKEGQDTELKEKIKK